jgi:hypothetical protein
MPAAYSDLPPKMAGFRRNDRQDSLGIGGRFVSEWVAELNRNIQDI